MLLFPLNNPRNIYFRQKSNEKLNQSPKVIFYSLYKTVSILKKADFIKAKVKLSKGEPTLQCKVMKFMA